MGEVASGSFEKSEYGAAALKNQLPTTLRKLSQPLHPLSANPLFVGHATRGFDKAATAKKGIDQLVKASKDLKRSFVYADLLSKSFYYRDPKDFRDLQDSQGKVGKKDYKISFFLDGQIMGKPVGTGIRLVNIKLWRTNASYFARK